MNFDIVRYTLIHQEKDGTYVYADQLQQRYLHGLRPVKFLAAGLFILGLIWMYKSYFLFTFSSPLRWLEDLEVVSFLLLATLIDGYQYLCGRTKMPMEDNRFLQTLIQCVLYALLGRFVIVQFFTEITANLNYEIQALRDQLAECQAQIADLQTLNRELSMRLDTTYRIMASGFGGQKDDAHPTFVDRRGIRIKAKYIGGYASL